MSKIFTGFIIDCFENANHKHLFSCLNINSNIFFFHKSEVVRRSFMSSIQFFCKHWGAFSCSLASMFIPTVKPYVPMTPDSMQLNICKISFPFAHFFSLCSHCLDQGPFSSFSENSVHMFICIFHFIIPSHKLAFLNCVFFCTFIT